MTKNIYELIKMIGKLKRQEKITNKEYGDLLEIITKIINGEKK